eukprot:gene11837-15798_t
MRTGGDDIAQAMALMGVRPVWATGSQRVDDFEILPISLLGDLVSLGTAVAFSIVCLSVIYLRVKHPDLPRPFKVPGGIATAVAGIFACLFLAWQNFKPMIQHAMDDNPLPLMMIAPITYIAYGFWNSKLAKGIDITEETTMSSPAEAMGSGVDNQKD